jgi:hypothetical protein
MNMKIDCEFNLTEDSKDLLEILRLHPGWSVYKSLLERQFIREYNRLRDLKDEKTYARLCGKLDGIEYAENVLEEELAQFDINSDKKEDHNQG